MSENNLELARVCNKVFNGYVNKRYSVPGAQKKQKLLTPLALCALQKPWTPDLGVPCPRLDGLGTCYPLGRARAAYHQGLQILNPQCTPRCTTLGHRQPHAKPEKQGIHHSHTGEPALMRQQNSHSAQQASTQRCNARNVSIPRSIWAQ